jgi:type IV fimbrial biogenesis protein FimT
VNREQTLAQCRRQAGVTLLELLTALAVIAVLLAIAVPSFVSLTQTNRVAGEINALANDLQVARATAIKEGLPVSICVSSNGTSCATASTSWQSGWIVFADPSNLTGTSPPTATGITPLRKQAGWTGSDTFVASNAGGTKIPSITFSRDGFAIGLAGPVMWSLNTSPVNATATRCVYINIAGHQQVMTKGQVIASRTCS